MELKTGFETIGNATIICHDRRPVLVTDPWITDTAYFGSWTHLHEIPDQQLKAIKACPFVWFSHGHPDHLSSDSLAHFKGKTILLGDHVGGRLRGDLLRMGHQVQVLETRKWVALSDRIRVLCIPDHFQDSILLIDINGRLLVNINDAFDRGWGRFVRQTIKQYETTFLLALSGFGDADMMNFFDTDGKRILPPAHRKPAVGASIAQKTAAFGTKYFVPFSSMHRYHRRDSIWANEYITELNDYAKGFESKTCRLLPAYIRFDCETDSFEEIKPKESPRTIREPMEFGDNWHDQFTEEDLRKVTTYFKSFSHLETFLDFVNFRVGGKDNVIAIAKKKFNRGITFEGPRNSLVTAAEYEIFDDILIGNFVKTTLTTNWPKTGLYPDFNPYVTKFGDNGRAKKRDEIESYFAEYRRRAPLDYLKSRIEERSKLAVAGIIGRESALFDTAKRAYWVLKRFGP